MIWLAFLPGLVCIALCVHVLVSRNEVLRRDVEIAAALARNEPDVRVVMVDLTADPPRVLLSSGEWCPTTADAARTEALRLTGGVS